MSFDLERRVWRRWRYRQHSSLQNSESAYSHSRSPHRCCRCRWGKRVGREKRCYCGFLRKCWNVGNPTCTCGSDCCQLPFCCQSSISTPATWSSLCYPEIKEGSIKVSVDISTSCLERFQTLPCNQYSMSLRVSKVSILGLVCEFLDRIEFLQID